MDRQTIQRLLRPIVVGKPLPTGHTLVAIEAHHHPADHRRDHVRLVFEPPLVVELSHRDGGGARFETKHLKGITDSSATSSVAVERTVELVAAALRKNDRLPVSRRLVHPGIRALGEPALWLVAGHLGNPLDLSIRALRLLSVADTIFVEQGDRADTEALYGRFEIGAPPRVVEIEETGDATARAFDAAVARGETILLFGMSEGLPSLVDPGWRVVRHARTRHPELSVRAVGGGAALGAALMHLDTLTEGFRFGGILDGRAASTIAGMCARPVGDALPLYFYAHGDTLRAAWDALCRAWPAGRGSLTLYLDLTREDERRMVLAPLPAEGTPAPDLDDRAKVVAVVTFD